MSTDKNKRASLLLRFFSGMRFPWVFAAFLTILGIDLVVPDFLPFADELLLGMMTLLLGAWRKRKDDAVGSAKDEPIHDYKVIDAERPTLPAPGETGRTV